MLIKDIPGYEGIYAITEEGRVFSYPKPKIHNGKWIKSALTGRGYLGVSICPTGAHKKTKTIHGLVAITFIPTESGKSDINHKDGNKLNNCVCNLEWVTKKENSRHAINTGLWKSGRRRFIIQSNKYGELIAEFESASEAERITNIRQTNIRGCCDGKYGYKSAGGFLWRDKEV